jgi:hypothetical protein
VFEKGKTYRHRRMLDSAVFVLEIIVKNDVITQMNVSWVNLKHELAHGCVGPISVRHEEQEHWHEVEYNGYCL